jgi:hypothetical protein
MTQEVTLELLKFRVPLKDAWDAATKTLLELENKEVVERLTFEEAKRLEDRFSNESNVDDCDAELLDLARNSAIQAIQARFSGRLPELPDRESDLLSQHTSVWNLIAQLAKKQSLGSKMQDLITSHSVKVLRGQVGDSWKARARNILNMMECLKGTTDKRISDLCLSDVFLCERELVTSSVKLIIKSAPFKDLMKAPDMVNDGEQTLPKLLVKLCSDTEFRQAFVWLPLDPESPLNQSGGSGVIPTNKEEYRFILNIILKILFGKLRQRGHGIDKRISIAERQSLILGYIGTVPTAEMDLVFKVLFGRVVNQNLHLGRIKPVWKDTFFVDQTSGLPILNTEVIESNSKIERGILESMKHLVAQMKRKADAFVPLLAVFVVASLMRGDDEQGKSKIAMLRLGELLRTYQHLGSETWAIYLEPLVRIFNHHLSRSSAAELSTVFGMVTRWAQSEELVGLYFNPILREHLLPELFKPRALSGKPAKVLFEMVLTLCGYSVDEHANSSHSYLQTRKALIREHKKTGGDMDSDSDDNDELSNTHAKPDESAVSPSIALIVDYIPSILTTVSMSLRKSADKSLALRVTVTVAKLAQEQSIRLPDDACKALLELIAAQLATFSKLPPRKARAAIKDARMLLEASSSVCALTAVESIPSSLLRTVSRLVLTMDDVGGRLLLSECILELCKKTSPNDVPAAEKLVELNSIKAKSAFPQPDTDRHVDVFQQILYDAQEKNKFHFLSSVMLIRHSLFLIASPACDSTLRPSVEAFLYDVGLVRDDQGRLPIPKLTMVVGQCHKLLEASLSDFTLRSSLKIICHYVKKYATTLSGADTENARLLHRDLLGDSTSDLLSLVIQLQDINTKRRRDALYKLAMVADKLTPYTLDKIVAPFAMQAVVQPGVGKDKFDNALADTGIKAMQVCPSMVSQLIQLVKVYMRKFEEREKVILKAVSKVTEDLLLSGKTLPVDQVERAQKELIPRLRGRVFDAKGMLRGSTLMGDQSEKHRLAREANPESEGVVKLEAVVALLEVLQFFSPATLESQTEQLVRIILQGLPNREEKNRSTARTALTRCAKVLGVQRLAWIMKEIRRALPRGGFQAAVSVFSCFSVLEVLSATDFASVLSTSQASELASEGLECLRIEDAQWAMLQNRTDGAVDEEVQLANQCMEAKRRKGHELVGLLAKLLPSNVVTAVLLRSVIGLFNSVERMDVEGLSSDEDDEDQEDNNDEEDSDDCQARIGKKRTTGRIVSVTETPAKRSKTGSQMNVVHETKKYMARIETAIVSVLQGIRENASYEENDRLGLCVQAMALFDDIASKKLRLDESRLFVKNELNRKLLDMDREDDRPQLEAKSRGVLLRQKQKEQTFLVQPGASTGRGHWVTEEWKQGKVHTSNKSKQVRLMDLRAVKTKVFGSMGLGLLNGLKFDSTKISDDSELKTALAKFVTRAFCSGIADLFQQSAKAVQTLVGIDTAMFNEKAMTMIAKRLMSYMEQLHEGGSDLSFTTLKQQRKAQSVEVASTCASLLLTLVSVDTKWVEKDMMETLAAHVLASLDKPALQLSSLQLLRKLFLGNKGTKFRSATVYDCFRIVGELIANATNTRVCELCGPLYAQFLLEFPHTQESITDKVLNLVQHATNASASISRSTALNALHAFVRTVPVDSLQDVYGPLMFVTLSANLSSEDDVGTNQLVERLLVSVVQKFRDVTKRERLIEIITKWPTSQTKHQFVLGSVLVSSLLAGAELMEPAKSVQVIVSVLEQLRFRPKNPVVEERLTVRESDESPDQEEYESNLFFESDVVVQGHVFLVQALGRLLESKVDTGDLQPLLEYVFIDLLNKKSAEHVPIVVEVLKLLTEIACSPQRALYILTEANALAPWVTLMRVMALLTTNTAETQFSVAPLSCKAIVSLLPLCPERTGESGRLAALLNKIRYEARRLIGRAKDSVIRLYSLLKLTTSLVLSAASIEDEAVIRPALDVLYRLKTINKAGEELSKEVGTIESAFELSVMRPIEQLGCLYKMASLALEALEKHYKAHEKFFTKQVTSVMLEMNKARRERKRTKMEAAVRDPQKYADEKTKKLKRKSVKRQERAKENVKRLKGLIN